MSYDPNSLVRIGSVPFSAGVSKSEFYYATGDTKAQVLTANYFNADYKRFDIADRITVVYGIGGTIGTMVVVVTSAKGVSPVVVAAAGQQPLTDNTGGTPGASLGANVAKQTVLLPLQLLDIATGTFKVAVPFAFTLLATNFRTAKPATTAAKAATLTPDINGTPVTGGVMALTSANQNTIGGAVAGTAVTAANVGTAGQTLGVTASVVTAFIEGDGWVEFTVRNDDLNNAIASLNAA
jgi:hypothetical protein